MIHFRSLSEHVSVEEIRHGENLTFGTKHLTYSESHICFRLNRDLEILYEITVHYLCLKYLSILKLYI